MCQLRVHARGPERDRTRLGRLAERDERHRGLVRHLRVRGIAPHGFLEGAAHFRLRGVRWPEHRLRRGHPPEVRTVVRVLGLPHGGRMDRGGRLTEQVTLPFRIRLDPRLDEERIAEEIRVPRIPRSIPRRLGERPRPIRAPQRRLHPPFLVELGAEREEDDLNEESRREDQSGSLRPDRDPLPLRARAWIALRHVAGRRRRDPAGRRGRQASQRHDGEAREILRRERGQGSRRGDRARADRALLPADRPERGDRGEQDDGERRDPAHDPLGSEDLDRLVVGLVRGVPELDLPVPRIPVFRIRDPERVHADAQHGMIVSHAEPALPDQEAGPGGGRVHARDLTDTLGEMGPHRRAREEERGHPSHEERDPERSRDRRSPLRHARASGNRSPARAELHDETQERPRERRGEETDPGAARERGGDHDHGDRRDQSPRDALDTSRTQGEPDNERRRHREIGAEHVGMPERPEDPHLPFEGRRPPPYQRIPPQELHQGVERGHEAREARGLGVPDEGGGLPAGNRARGEVDGGRRARRDETRGAVGCPVETQAGVGRGDRRGDGGAEKKEHPRSQGIAPRPGREAARERGPIPRRAGPADRGELARQDPPEKHQGRGREQHRLWDFEAFLGQPGKDDRDEGEHQDEDRVLDRERTPGAPSRLHAWRRLRHPIASGRRGVWMEGRRSGFEIT